MTPVNTNGGFVGPGKPWTAWTILRKQEKVPLGRMVAAQRAKKQTAGKKLILLTRLERLEPPTGHVER